MRKKKLLTTEAVLFAGIIAAFLRFVEIRTIFEPATGLAVQNSLISILLAILTIAILIKAVWYSISLTANDCIEIKTERPFSISKVGVAVISVLGAIIALGSAVNYFLDIKESTLFRALFLILGVLSGISMIVMSNGKVAKTGTWACIPTLFMCYWLVLTYKENNTNPVLLEYCYRCLAAAAATSSFYYAAGHYYGKISPKRTIVSHLAGIYFCLLTVSDTDNIAQAVMYVALAIYQLIVICAYIRGFVYSSDEDE